MYYHLDCTESEWEITREAIMDPEKASDDYHIGHVYSLDCICIVLVPVLSDYLVYLCYDL